MEKELTKLQSLMGKTVMHNTRNYKLLYFEQDGAILRLATDKKIFKFQNGDLNKFLKEISEVDETSMAIYNQASRGVTVVSQMQDILLENIKKVQADPNYVPQAKEINKNVNSMIDLAKTQIELVKIMEGRK